jgi:hypothetical protein
MSEKGVIKHDCVVNIMLAVDRSDFCPTNAYIDRPQKIGYGATISAPHMVGIHTYHNICIVARSSVGITSQSLKWLKSCIRCR